MSRLRASFEVRAGIVPGYPQPELSQQWHYTEDDYQADQKVPKLPEGQFLDGDGPRDQPGMTQFSWLMLEATRYQRKLINPNRLNWVEGSWIWY